MATLLTAVALLAGLALVAAPVAEAHGRPPVYRRGPAFVGGFGFYGFPYFGFGYGYGYGFGPYGAPFAYYPEGGLDMGAALVAGYGAVDLNAKPGEAEVWVDGKYVAEAKDLDGYPTYLWLPEGAHRIAIYKGGHERFDEEIDVRRGMRKDLKVRLDKGESDPPGLRPEKQKQN